MTFEDQMRELREKSKKFPELNKLILELERLEDEVIEEEKKDNFVLPYSSPMRLPVRAWKAT